MVNSMEALENVYTMKYGKWYGFFFTMKYVHNMEIELADYAMKYDL